MQPYLDSIRQTLQEAAGPPHSGCRAGGERGQMLQGLDLDVELLEETTAASAANQQCSVVALAGRSANATVLALTDRYLDWGADQY